MVNQPSDRSSIGLTPPLPGSISPIRASATSPAIHKASSSGSRVMADEVRER
jgi:hypothetical protein